MAYHRGGVVWGPILWRASVRLRREDRIRWGSSTVATLFDLFRGAGLNFYRQGQPRNTPIRDD